MVACCSDAAAASHAGKQVRERGRYKGEECRRRRDRAYGIEQPD